MSEDTLSPFSRERRRLEATTRRLSHTIMLSFGAGYALAHVIQDAGVNQVDFTDFENTIPAEALKQALQALEPRRHYDGRIWVEIKVRGDQVLPQEVLRSLDYGIDLTVEAPQEQIAFNDVKLMILALEQLEEVPDGLENVCWDGDDIRLIFTIPQQRTLRTVGKLNDVKVDRLFISCADWWKMQQSEQYPSASVEFQPGELNQHYQYVRLESVYPVNLELDTDDFTFAMTQFDSERCQGCFQNVTAKTAHFTVDKLETSIFAQPGEIATGLQGASVRITAKELAQGALAGLPVLSRLTLEHFKAEQLPLVALDDVHTNELIIKVEDAERWSPEVLSAHISSDVGSLVIVCSMRDSEANYFRTEVGPTLPGRPEVQLYYISWQDFPNDYNGMSASALRAISLNGG